MKRRRRQTATADPAADLVALVDGWETARAAGDHKAAQGARRRADRILKANPHYLDRPPMGAPRSHRVSKSAYIDWQLFIDYLKK
jgi:uncharacterized protein with von Willebrand factor type A (vWA) domain